MVSILLMTHGQIGLELLETAKNILGHIKTPISCLSVSSRSNLTAVSTQAAELITRLDQGEGVLIMTDLYGATPHNIANNLKTSNKALVSGLNLPMLLRALNYAEEYALDILADKAQQGGHIGITCHLPISIDNPAHV